jgi:hypothetical protein
MHCLIKPFIVLKNGPYICFGQLTGHPQGQLEFKVLLNSACIGIFTSDSEHAQ